MTVSPIRTMPAALALLALDAAALTALWGCGLRTDPDSSAPVCIEGEDTDGEPRTGSCEAPIDVPAGEIIVQGQLGGCDGANGWCGRDGGPEDVYRIATPNPIDMHVRFNPAETDFIPTLRILGGAAGTVDPCTFEVSQSDVCTPDASLRERWSWLAQPGETYIIVDGAGGGGKYEFEITYGVGAFGECEAEEIIAMEYDVAVTRVGTFEAVQGTYDGACQTPGDDRLFTVQLPGPGTLTATAETASGDGIASIRTGCAGNTEQSCGVVAQQFFDSAGTANVVVDSTGVDGGNYSLVLRYE